MITLKFVQVRCRESSCRQTPIASTISIAKTDIFLRNPKEVER